MSSCREDGTWHARSTERRMMGALHASRRRRSMLSSTRPCWPGDISCALRSTPTGRSTLNIAADEAELLALSEERTAPHCALIEKADLLFGIAILIVTMSCSRRAIRSIVSASSIIVPAKR